jgi:hypothetical protein
MKHVLFLAPSYNYVKTVVKNLTTDVQRNDIAFYTRGTTSGNTEFCTKNVEVKFIWDDPAKWCFDGFKFDEVYGKKELVNVFVEHHPFRFGNAHHKTSLSRYVIEQSRNEKYVPIDELTPTTPHNGTYLPDIKKVHFNYPHTIVIWADGTKTIVKCQEGDFYDNTVGLAMAISKKALGNSGNYYNTFKKHLPVEVPMTDIDDILNSILKSMEFNRMGV